MSGIASACSLATVTPAEGNITALETKGKHIFVGTDLGYFSKWTVTSLSAKDVTATKEGSLILQDRKRISMAYHDSIWSRVVVLCGEMVYYIDTTSFTVICAIADTKGANCIAVSPVHFDRNGEETHLFCVSLPRRRLLLIFSYTLTQVHQVQQLFLPSQAHCLSFFEDSICCGHLREYSLLNVHDGSATGLLQLSNQLPLSALLDSDVLLRLNEISFVVSMKQQNSPQPASATKQSTSPVSVKYSIRFDSEPLAIGYQHPYILAFQRDFVDVYSIYEHEIIQRMPISECALSTTVGTNEMLVAASRHKVYVLQLHPLDDQLWDLVKQRRVEDAFDLLHHHEIASTKNQQKEEVKLNIMAGIAFLHNNDPGQALMHCSCHIDVREILLHLPALKPHRDPEDKDDAFWNGWVPQCKYNTLDMTLRERWKEVYEVLPRDGTPLEKYLKDSEVALDKALMFYLTSRRESENSIQRRCIDYALLVLYFNHGEYKEVYRLLSNANDLDVRDAGGFFRRAGEYRALALLYMRKGMHMEAHSIFEDELCIAKRYETLRKKFPGVRLDTPFLPPRAAAPPQRARNQEDNISEILFAIECSSVSYVTFLIEDGPERMFLTDTEGNTPLHVAVLFSVTHTPCTHVVTLLVDRGADIYALNDRGQTPLDLAWHCDVSGRLFGLLLSLAEMRDVCNTFANERLLSLPTEYSSRDMLGIEVCYGLDRGQGPHCGSWCGRFLSSVSPTSPTMSSSVRTGSAFSVTHSQPSLVSPRDQIHSGNRSDTWTVI